MSMTDESPEKSEWLANIAWTDQIEGRPKATTFKVLAPTKLEARAQVDLLYENQVALLELLAGPGAKSNELVVGPYTLVGLSEVAILSQQAEDRAIIPSDKQATESGIAKKKFVVVLPYGWSGAQSPGEEPDAGWGVIEAASEDEANAVMAKVYRDHEALMEFLQPGGAWRKRVTGNPETILEECQVVLSGDSLWFLIGPDQLHNEPDVSRLLKKPALDSALENASADRNESKVTP